MFTICTGCKRQFRILADHLSAANGLVKCGFCGEQFNALEHLSDEPTQSIEVEAVSDAAAIESNLPEANEAIDNLEKVLQDADDPNLFNNTIDFELDDVQQDVVEVKAETTPAEQKKAAEDKLSNFVITPIEESVSNEDADHFSLEPKEKTTESKEEKTIAELLAPKQEHEPEKEDITEPMSAKDESSFLDDFPEEYLEEEQTKPGRLSFYLWGFGSVFLMLFGGLQFAWFNRDQLYQQYPQALPYAKQLCQHMQCEVYRQSKLEEIELVSRDVRAHPRFENSLLVNGVFANRSDRTMEYPGLRLSFFDQNGRSVSYRQFAAKEYLDQSIELEAGLKPNNPVHFVLELSGTLDEAVSFEFDFY